MTQASPTQRADSRALLSSARHTGSRSTYNRSTSAVSESENNSLQRLSRDTTAEASVVTASCVTAAQDPGSAAQLSQRPAGTLVPEISSNPIPRCCLHGPSTPFCKSTRNAKVVLEQKEEHEMPQADVPHNAWPQAGEALAGSSSACTSQRKPHRCRAS